VGVAVERAAGAFLADKHFRPLPRPGRSVRKPFPDWVEYRPGSIWIYDTTHFTAAGMAVLIIEDLVSRNWLATDVSVEETSTQVELAFTEALQAEGLLGLVTPGTTTRGRSRRYASTSSPQTTRRSGHEHPRHRRISRSGRAEGLTRRRHHAHPGRADRDRGPGAPPAAPPHGGGDRRRGGHRVSRSVSRRSATLRPRRPRRV
jgi:hypothetical protein